VSWEVLALVTPWLLELAQDFVELVGSRVVSWRGTEMALRGEDGGHDGPAVFRDPGVALLQLTFLTAVLEDGTVRTVDTDFQTDAEWGLVLRAERRELHDADGVFRPAYNLALPTGAVTEVRVFEEFGTVSEVLLRLGGHPLLLIAGEVYPTWTERLEFHRFDESVLAFVDPAAADAVEWFPPRRDRVLLTSRPSPLSFR
jgi:hypothetical protein